MQRQKKDGRGSFDDIIINFEKLRQNIKNIEATYTINHKRRNISGNGGVRDACRRRFWYRYVG